jgi:hypothetical protein
MKPTQKELTNWAITQIQEKYKNDIALLIGISGHALKNDCHGECFDYFVPANDNGNKLAQTFIIDGVGHDLYPRSWKRIENMAEFNDDFTKGLADAIILYSRNEDDKKRFAEFQEKLILNLKDNNFMFKKALLKLDTAMEIYRTVMFEDSFYKVKMGSGLISHYLSIAVACMNGTYFKQTLELETSELSQMKEIPDNFITYFEDIIIAKSIEDLKKLCYEIISTTRKFIEAHRPPKTEKLKTPVYKDLAAWYEELSLVWRRLYYYCTASDYRKAFNEALSLQYELNIIKEEFGLMEMDLLGSFEPENLILLKQRAQELEMYIISEIESHGVSINKYDTLEQFLVKNS